MRADRTIRGRTGRAETSPPAHQKSVELRLVFPCDKMNVRAALQNTMAGLGAMHLSDDDRSTIELVLAEVLNNVSKHAYRDEPQGLIELHLSQNTSGLRCRVVDRGDPMPGMHLPPGPLPESHCATKDQPEGGFGWYLIHHLSRELNYMRDGNRNMLTFRIETAQVLRKN
ncbi:ATP-binding protein [Oceaniglobus indicus]|uniref:ATP-binding protein n=1 Tax=Oceaniglobus indicus TaxID=2047749 RepID=UPI000C175C93|nr:ATP-binding protein [Oceaniglobus indicus]